MSGDFIENPPRSFYAICGLAFAWNVVGVVTYLLQVTMTDEALGALDPTQRAFLESTPTWLTSVFALAVHAGALGSLLLLLRKAWSIPVLILSLACIVVQMGYSTFMTDAIEVFGAGAAGQAAMVTLVGFFLVWYARRAKNNDWIK